MGAVHHFLFPVLSSVPWFPPLSRFVLRVKAYDYRRFLLTPPPSCRPCLKSVHYFSGGPPPSPSCSGGPSPSISFRLFVSSACCCSGGALPSPSWSGGPPPSLSCRPCAGSVCFCSGGAPPSLSWSGGGPPHSLSCSPCARSMSCCLGGSPSPPSPGCVQGMPTSGLLCPPPSPGFVRFWSGGPPPSPPLLDAGVKRALPFGGFPLLFLGLAARGGCALPVPFPCSRLCFVGVNFPRGLLGFFPTSQGTCGGYVVCRSLPRQ